MLHMLPSPMASQAGGLTLQEQSQIFTISLNPLKIQFIKYSSLRLLAVHPALNRPGVY